MPLNCPYETRFKQQYTNIVDCLNASVPVQTQSGGTNWFPADETQSIAGGINFSAAIKTDGTLWLWGEGSLGQLGNNLSGAPGDQSSPVQAITGGTNWCQVSLGNDFTAAIKTDGTLWMWGEGSGGQLGNNCDTNAADRSSPVQTVSATNCWKQVSAGANFSGAIKTDGTLWLWGSNTDAQIGNNDKGTGPSSPVQTVSTGTNWKQVSAGGFHTASIKTDGTLWLWGCGGSGQLGNNSTGAAADRSSPVQTMSATTNWKSVSLGYQHSAAVKTDGTLWLWGSATLGILGNNSTGDGVTTYPYSSPVQTIATGTNWKQVSLGCEHSSAVKTDGTLWLWGNNQFGRLGNNATASRSSPVQTASQTTLWKQVALGRDHSISNKIDGTLWGWGRASSGALGDNTTADKSSPVQTVSAVATWVTYDNPFFTSSLGCIHSAAIKTDGTLWLWGSATCGKLGNNSLTNQSSPVQTVSATTDWKQVSLGCSHSAAIKIDGTLWLWGDAASGRLGNNLTTDVSSPVQTVSNVTTWKQVSVSCYSAAIKTDGTLWLWGEAGLGQLGNNSTTDRSSPVQTVSTGTNWKQIALSDNHSASIKTDGTLWLWGAGSFGRLGNNNTIDRSSPVQTVSTGTNWKQVSLGGLRHTAAIKTDGTLWLWGENNCGKLGTNTLTDHQSPVQTVTTGTNWKQVSIGCNHSAAIKTDGTLWLWGEGLCGKLGNNATTNQSSPIQIVSIGITWQELSEHQGGNHSAAISSDNRFYLWGDNSVGQLGCNLSDGSQICTDLGNILVDKDYMLEVYPNIVPWMKAPALWGWGAGACGSLGDNSTTSKSSPVQTISYGTNWQQISAGGGIALNGGTAAAIKNDGTLWSWGDGSVGRLGNNSTIDRSSPVQTVSNVTTWKQVSVGSSHSAAIKTDGTLWLWGCGICGALGNNLSAGQSSPVQTVSNVATWKQVSAGSCISASVKTDGTLWLWGRNECGQLGDGTGGNRSSPVQTVSNVTTWKQVSVGTNHSAAIKTDGTLWLWGSGTSGRLGNNNTIAVCSPVQTVSNVTTWKQINMGVSTSAAIKTDGTLWLWGDSANGLLVGSNSTIDYSSPVQTISTTTNWKKIHLVSSAAMAIKTDGTLWLWGCGICGQLGNNGTQSSSSPVQTISGGNDWKEISGSVCSNFAIRETYEW